VGSSGSSDSSKRDAVRLQRCESLHCAAGRFCHSANAIFEHIAEELRGAGEKGAGQTSERLADQKFRCSTCPTGQFSGRVGVLECTPCPGGKFQAIPGQKSCISCLAGQAQHAAGKTECLTCTSGKYSKHQAVRCNICMPGRFSDRFGAKTCAACPVGKYQHEYGKSDCRRCWCSSGQYRPAVGAANAPSVKTCQCQNCPRGKYQGKPNQAQCLVCLPGRFALMAGRETCKMCPQGMFQPKARASSCVQCRAGSYAHRIGRNMCKSCPVGMYAANAGAPGCKRCESGRSQAKPSSTACTPCADGKVQSLTATNCESARLRKHEVATQQRLEAKTARAAAVVAAEHRRAKVAELQQQWLAKHPKPAAAHGGKGRRKSKSQQSGKLYVGAFALTLGAAALVLVHWHGSQGSAPTGPSYAPVPTHLQAKDGPELQYGATAAQSSAKID
jgi:hypothetical protein